MAQHSDYNHHGIPLCSLQASPFLSIAQYHERERVWYNCYNGFVQNLTYLSLLIDLLTYSYPTLPPLLEHSVQHIHSMSTIVIHNSVQHALLQSHRIESWINTYEPIMTTLNIVHQGMPARGKSTKNMFVQLIDIIKY